MGFSALKFSFDGIPSELYNLYIIELGSSGLSSSSGGSDVELYTQKIFRRPVPYFYGVQQTPALSFDMTIGSLEYLDRGIVSSIQKWLFGRNDYKKLQIIQDDMLDVYFNCFLTEPELVTVGNLPIAFKMKVVCDAPWAWYFPMKQSFNLNNELTNFNFMNTSDNTEYLYPKITLTTSSVTNGFTIKNITDNNREFTFTGLKPNETLTIDCSRQIVTSSTGLRRMGNFNKNFFRLLPNMNNLQCIGSLSKFEMEYQLARKVGG